MELGGSDTNNLFVWLMSEERESNKKPMTNKWRPFKKGYKNIIPINHQLILCMAYLALPVQQVISHLLISQSLPMTLFLLVVVQRNNVCHLNAT